MNEVWCKLSKIFEIAEGGGLADGWGDDSIVNCGCSENSMPKEFGSRFWSATAEAVPPSISHRWHAVRQQPQSFESQVYTAAIAKLKGLS